ncbi:hypothetical protein K0U83_22290 [bacterium]|nr:hypothetical protein [bacterium]
MANEVLYSGLGDLRLAKILNNEIQLLLADRFSLRTHPSIFNAGNIAGRGSSVISIPQAGLEGYDLMTAVGGETASASNVALTDASADITIARFALRREISDLANMTDSVGLTAERLAADMVGGYEMAVTNAICDTIDGFTATAGTTGVDLSVDDFFSALFTLEQASVRTPYVSVLHPVQVTDLQNSIRAEGGALQYIAATQEMLAAKGQGFAGSFLGVDIFKSSKVPTANGGADRAGAMMGYGAVGMAEGSVRPISALSGALQFPAGTVIAVEYERNSATALTAITGNAYFGVALLQDAMGVSIISDA